MAGGIEIETGAHDVGQIDFGHQQPLAAAQWPGQHLAHRRHDDTAAADDRHICSAVNQRDGFAQRCLCRPKPLAGRYQKKTAFMGDVAHGDFPLRPFIHCGRRPDGDALFVQGEAQRRHEIFPADHCADRPHRAGEGAHVAAIAHAPHQPFGGRRHQLAAVPGQPAIGIEVQRRAIQGRPIADDGADNHRAAQISRQIAQRQYFRPIQIDGLFPIAPKGIAAGGRAIAQPHAKVGALGVTAQQGFRQHQQIGRCRLQLVPPCHQRFQRLGGGCPAADLQRRQSRLARGYRHAASNRAIAQRAASATTGSSLPKCACTAGISAPSPLLPAA